MSLYMAQLVFSGPVHFGSDTIKLEDSEEVIHSDSLFSALCHSWALLYGKADLDALLVEFDEHPPFLLSSGFVFSEDTLFLPRPLSPFPGFQGAEEQLRNTQAQSLLEDTDYISFQVFDAWAAAQRISYDSFYDSTVEYTRSFRSFEMPRAAIGRKNTGSVPFLCGTVQFSEGCGLYVLFRFYEDHLVPKVEQALHFLGEMGLGGERAYGYGRFKPMFMPADPKWGNLLEPPGDLFMALSLCHPVLPMSEILQGAAYNLLKRRGWCHSPFTKRQLKRKTVTMFAEGSVFQYEIKGHLVDVTPSAWDRVNQHPIYRYGYAVMVPVRSLEPPPVRIYTDSPGTRRKSDRL